MRSDDTPAFFQPVKTGPGSWPILGPVLGQESVHFPEILESGWKLEGGQIITFQSNNLNAKLQSLRNE